MSTANQPTQARLFTLPSTSDPAIQRTLAYDFYGVTEDPSAPTVLYFHGYPASHAEASLFHPFALARGLRIVAITRPGYGESTYVPSRQLLDWPADVLALTDHCNIKQFGIIGVSGGGPYVFTCLQDARLKPRILAAAVVCGLFPSEFGLAGMNLMHRLMINASAWVPGVFAYLLRGAFEKMRAEDGKGGVEAYLSTEMEKLPPVDLQAWKSNENGFRDAMVAACRLMLRNPKAAETAAQEAGFFGRAWGFKLEDVNAQGEWDGRLCMWHGTEDINIPCRMAREAKELLGEGVELRISEGEAHGSLAARKVEEVIEWITSKINN